MANKRLITSDIWADDFFGTLPMMQRLLWIGLFSRVADDQGRMVDNPIVIRSLIFPYDDIKASDIGDGLDKFANDNKILRYSIGDKKYIQILTWWEHQTMQWAMHSKYPAPPEWNDRIRTTYKGKYVAINWPTSKPSLPDHLDNPPGQPTWDTGVDGQELNLNPVNESILKEEERARAAASSSPIPSDPKFSDRETGQARASFGDSHARASEKLYQLITGQISIPPDQRGAALETLGNILDHFRGDVEAAAASGKPVFAAWCNTRGKNGSTYSKININWITKWLERLAVKPEVDTVDEVAEVIRRSRERITGRRE